MHPNKLEIKFGLYYSHNLSWFKENTKPIGNQINFLNQILSINIKLIHLPLQTNAYKIVDSNLLT